MAYAIALQAREQAPSYEIAQQIGALKGTWTPEELADAFEAGRISAVQKAEYQKLNERRKFVTLGRKQTRGRSRYGR